MSMYRLRVPSFVKILWTCSLTVPVVNPNSRAISLFTEHVGLIEVVRVGWSQRGVGGHNPSALDPSRHGDCGRDSAVYRDLTVIVLLANSGACAAHEVQRKARGRAPELEGADRHARHLGKGIQLGKSGGPPATRRYHRPKR